jgi:hypothetical protein
LALATPAFAARTLKSNSVRRLKGFAARRRRRSPALHCAWGSNPWVCLLGRPPALGTRLTQSWLSPLSLEPITSKSSPPCPSPRISNRRPLRSSSLLLPLPPRPLGVHCAPPSPVPAPLNMTLES